jgi:hypothetical protein
MARSPIENGGDPLTEDFPKGPGIGEPVPDFTLPDQFGNQTNYSEVRGNGQAIIVFYRSASW